MTKRDRWMIAVLTVLWPIICAGLLVVGAHSGFVALSVGLGVWLGVMALAIGMPE